MIDIHILVPVWGERYLTSFMSTSLPALLSPGNIPSLVGECRITMVFLTTQDSVAILQKHPTYAVLEQFCAVKYIFIEDLIADSSHFAVPLTLAFVRGIVSAGPAMTNTYFISYNADFVLADGSLIGVLDMIKQGKDIILATSFRVNAESILPCITGVLSEQSTQLCIPPRDLVELALGHVHHTTHARIANQETYNSAYWNQVYWQVDDNTILARYFLPTQFCVRPRVYRETISSFCDYGLLPDFCPQGSIGAITDSDDFFMVELQHTEQELYFLEFGKPSPQKTARSLSSWTTEQHREISKFEAVIHSGALPAHFGRQKEDFQRFMDQVHASLSPHPLEHEQHFHWIEGLLLWTPQKIAYDQRVATTGADAQFTGIQFPLVRQYASFLKKAKRPIPRFLARLMGGGRSAYPWHPLWVNYRSLRTAWKRLARPGVKILYVTDCFEYDSLIPVGAQVHKAFLADVANGFLDKIYPNEKYDSCVLVVPVDGNIQISSLLKTIAPALLGDKKILVYLGRNMERLQRPNAQIAYAFYKALRLLSECNAQVAYIGNLRASRLLTKIFKTASRLKSEPFLTVCWMTYVSFACFINTIYCSFQTTCSRKTGMTGILAELSLHRTSYDKR